MALGSQARVGINTQTCLLRRLSQNSTPTPTNSKIPSEDFCRSQAGLVHLERQLFSLVNGIAAAEDVLQTCLSLLSSCDSTRGLFKVFCCCSWADRYNIPVIARLFYKLVCYHQDSNISSSSSLLLTELETACEELLRVLTHLGIPTSLQLDVVSLLYNLSRLKDLPLLHREAVESYLEEIARAFWPYCMPSAPNLWGSELFCDAQCDVLKACGKGLEDKCPVNTARTFDIINTKLIAGDIPQYSRFRLLEVKELRCSGWELSEEAMYYYKSANSKFLCQAKQSLLDISPAASPKNGITCIRRMLDKPDQNKTDTQSVTVVRISESDLRSSCQNITKVRLGNEENDLGENNSATVDDYNGWLSEKSKSRDLGDIVDQDSVEDANVSPQDQSKIQHFPKMVPALLRTDLNKPRRPSKNCFSSSTVSWLRDSDEAMDSIHHPDNPAERSASPCSTDSNGSDDVFANAVDPLAAEVISHRDSRTVPALYRAGLNKSRLPVKSDSAVPALSPSRPRKLALSDSQQERYEKNLAETSEFSPQELSRDNGNKVVEDRPNLEQHTSGKGIENEVEHMETFVEHKTNLGMSTGQDLPVSSTILTELEMVSREKSSVSLQQNGEHPKENWREKTLNRRSGNFKDTELDIVRGSEVDENWRNQESGSSAECWGVDSRASSCETNWRERSCSVEEPNKDGGRSRRWSSAGVPLARQDSEDKGKRSSFGGFGHLKQDSPISSGDETSKEDVFEIHLSEEESQGLKWRKLAEIQNDCSCKIFLNRERCVIEIRGDPQLCKVAKKRVYSVIATIDEQFGTLVPLSEEILGQLHTEGCHVLAERLAQCSGADVKLISDTQLFISGYRNYVDLAKTQLTKIKVMLKYTDDPDVVSLDHQDNSEGQTQLIDKLFAALDGRSQVTQDGRSQVTQGSQATDHSRELGTCEGSLSREFLLSCARSPVASQRPADLRLDRKEDWVMDIVLTTGRKGAQEAMGPSVVQKKGFGSPRQLAQNKEFF